VRRTGRTRPVQVRSPWPAQDPPPRHPSTLFSEQSWPLPHRRQAAASFSWGAFIPQNPPGCLPGPRIDGLPPKHPVPGPKISPGVQPSFSQSLARKRPAVGGPSDFSSDPAAAIRRAAVPR
jgi:hypothetical protein